MGFRRMYYLFNGTKLTGTGGGSLWILCSNLFLTIFLLKFLNKKKRNNLYLVVWLGIIIFPSAISVYRYFTIKQNSEDGSEIVIVQPNTDPYTEKSPSLSKIQLKNVIRQAGSVITDSTSWLITPETTVDDPVNLNDLPNNKYIRMIKRLIEQHPGINVVTGIVTYKLYPAMKEAPTISARRIDATGLYYDHFNSAVQIDTGITFGIYHKSKLAPE